MRKHGFWANVAALLGTLALFAFFVACATLKRGARDEIQCIFPTVEAVEACISFNPISACPALQQWFKCLEEADAKSQPIKIVQQASHPDAGARAAHDGGK